MCLDLAEANGVVDCALSGVVNGVPVLAVSGVRNAWLVAGRDGVEGEVGLA